MNYLSLFSGIGGFDLAFNRAGMQSMGMVEIDKNCQNVLHRRFEYIHVFDDVKEINESTFERNSIDLICGGFPCQDLSIAGKRAGLAGERSGLWFEFARIIDELEPQWVVIENVPGLLSSNKGADFAVIIHWLAERGYGVAWRVLDAQYFGVAQKRRRPLIVGSLGDGRAAEVLFERESMSRDTPQGRKAGEEVAGTVTDRVGGSGSGWARWNETEGLTPSFGLNSRNNRLDGESQTFIVEQNNMASTPDMISLQSNPAQPAICMSTGQANAGIVNDGSPSLTAAYEQPIVVFNADRDGQGSQENISPTLTHKGDGKQAHNAYSKVAIAWEMQHASEAYRESGEIAPTLQQRMGTGGNQVPLVGVRRLTPVECERLQGFPDDWTDGQADSVRYRQLGNAVAVPVVEWIGRRIAEVNNNQKPRS